MTIAHHPTDDRLADFAAGRLDLGQQLLVASHLERCGACSSAVSALEHVAGAMLEDLPPTPMQAGARDRVLASAEFLESASLPAVSDVPELPVILRDRRMGPWRWVGPGVHLRSIDIGDIGKGESRVFLLRAQPGTHLPQHTHSGTELTLLLKGSFAHEGGRFASGDFEDADDSIEHQPVVDSDIECICLVAMDGELRLSGWIGRVMQPFVRI